MFGRKPFFTSEAMWILIWQIQRAEYWSSLFWVSGFPFGLKSLILRLHCRNGPHYTSRNGFSFHWLWVVINFLPLVVFRERRGSCHTPLRGLRLWIFEMKGGFRPFSKFSGEISRLGLFKIYWASNILCCWWMRGLQFSVSLFLGF